MNFDLLKELSIYDEYIQNPLLSIYQVPHKLSIEHVKPEEPKKNQILLDCTSLKEEIPLNTEFDVIFSMDDIENFIGISASLKKIYRNPYYITETLFELEKGICLIEFQNGLPTIIERVRPAEGNFYSDDYETLYLSNQILLNKIIELMI